MDRIIELPNSVLLEMISILDYRKLAQNAIYSELVSEGMALNYCGSALYDF
jgi:hypothetical protein